MNITKLITLLLAMACTNIKATNKITPDQKEKKNIENIEKIENENIPSKILNAKEELNQIPKVAGSELWNTHPRDNSPKVEAYCKKIDEKFKKYKWDSICSQYSWNHVRNSHLGLPIIWYVFGEEIAEIPNNKFNTTMILCGVHGDEITPIKFCFDIMEELKKNPELFKDHVVIVAPIVAPDSFFSVPPTRTNARGVDVNRNFKTDDWDKDALRLWATRYHKDKRRYPGKMPNTEQETIFQINLINRYNPQKIISVHAPLSLLDYDGPTFGNTKGDSAKDLLEQMSDKAGQYKISNYPFFPGSLGNWAGNEKNIPTFTLELPNSDWTKTDKYFNMFKAAIFHAIKHDLKEYATNPK